MPGQPAHLVQELNASTVAYKAYSIAQLGYGDTPSPSSDPLLGLK